jgi:hypothetical protein
MKRCAIVFLLMLFALGCGTNGGNQTSNAGQSSPVASSSPNVKLHLYLFAAENCNPCRAELSQIGANLNTQLGSKMSEVQVVVYVTNGKDSGTPPTQAIADNFKQMIGFNFQAVPDPWNRTTYRRFYGLNSSGAIPAVVVTDANDANPYLFQPGTFVQDQVIAYLSGHL